MRRLVTVLSLAALSAPVAAHAQIAEVELPPSDVADAGSDVAATDEDAGDIGYDVAVRDDDAEDPAYDDASPYHDVADDKGDYADASDRVADILDDPARQEDIAAAMSDMMRALMTIRVGPILDAAREVDPRAADDYADVDPDATIGDIASRGDPDYEDRIEDGIRDGTARSGTIVREFAKMMPTLIAIAKDMGAQAQKAIERERR
ncbi:MAG: hypothetical protein GW859_05830 [Sphingomonadales bacterium]|nr:hypothetical protein [Sphingomonadales bacterium]